MTLMEVYSQTMVKLTRFRIVLKKEKDATELSLHFSKTNDKDA